MTASDSVERQSLPDQVARRLHALIVDGTFPSGSQLPHQRELARRFDVSVTVIRESLALLAAGDLIRSRSGQGTFVTDHPPAVLHFPTWVSTSVTEAAATETIEAREVLERAVAHFAALRRTDEDMGRLQECLSTMRANSSDGTAYASADLAFHLALATAARNRPLASALTGLRRIIRAGIVERATREIHEGTIGDSVAAHSALLEAVGAGDAAKAEEAMNRIMTRALALYADSMAPSRPSLDAGS